MSIIEILVTAGACGLSCALGVFLGQANAEKWCRQRTSEAWSDGRRAGLADAAKRFNEQPYFPGKKPHA